MTFLVGITGRAQAGKGTVGDYLQAVAHARGLVAAHRGFADPLKRSAARALGYDGPDPLAIGNALRDPASRVTVEFGGGQDGVVGQAVLSGRGFLQRYGQEAHRDLFGADFWIAQALSPEALEGLDLLVLSDLRYENEAEAVKALGGEVWEVQRPGQALTGPEADHASERGLLAGLVDRVLVNRSSREALYRQVDGHVKYALPGRPPVLGVERAGVTA